MSATKRDPRDKFGLMVEESELFAEDPVAARKLGNADFCPIQAYRLQPGDVVAFYDTDAFGMGSVGDYRISRVRELVWEEGIVRSGKDKGKPWRDICGVLLEGESEPTYAEYYMEVWVR